MKKSILSILFFLITLTFINAQSRFSFGARAGQGFSNINNLSYPMQKRGSFQAGVLTEIKIVKFFYLQGEVLYSLTGAKNHMTNTSIFTPTPYPELTLYANHSSLEIPMQAKIKVGKIIKPYYMLGLAPSFILSASITDDKTDNSINTTNNHKTASLNLYNTLGVEVKIGKVHPFIDARYVNGLTGLYKYSSGNNLQWTVNAGVRF